MVFLREILFWLRLKVFIICGFVKFVGLDKLLNNFIEASEVGISSDFFLIYSNTSGNVEELFMIVLGKELSLFELFFIFFIFYLFY